MHQSARLAPIASLRISRFQLLPHNPSIGRSIAQKPLDFRALKDHEMLQFFDPVPLQSAQNSLQLNTSAQEN